MFDSLHELRKPIIGVLLFSAIYGCRNDSNAEKASHLSFDRCPDLISAEPSVPTPLVTFDRTQSYEIGFTFYQTNIPGSRYINDITQRSMIYSTNSESIRAVGKALTNEANTSSSIVGWSPDGSMAVVEYNWSDPSNAQWEMDHGSFHMDRNFFKSDDYLVHVDENDRIENITAVDSTSFFNSAAFFYPNDMTKIGFTSYSNSSLQPYVMNRDGTNKTPLLNDRSATYGLSVSPDHTKIAYNSDYRLYIANIDGSSRQLINTGFTFNFIPQWSPDSRYILFIGNPDGERSLFLFDIKDWKLHFLAGRGGYAGSMSVYDIMDFRDGTSDIPVWSPDGKWIYFSRKTGGSVEIFRVSGPANNKNCAIEQITKSANTNLRSLPAVAPDGKYLAYVSFPGGVRQITTLNLATLEESILTKYTIGYAGMWPRWRPTSRRK